MKKKMKNVAILLTSEPQHGGEHQYLVLLIESLVRFDGKYYNLIPICCNQFWIKWCKKRKKNYVQTKVKKYTESEIKLQTMFPAIHMYQNMMEDSLGKIIRERKIHLLICGQQGMFLPKYLCRQIHPVHDLMHRYEGKFQEIKKTYESREIVFKSIARLSDTILVDSELGKQQFIDSYDNRIHLPQIEILPFVVPRHIRMMKEEFIETPQKYIFYPAQFWEHKNHINLIRAIKIVKEKYPDICLVLVGSEKNALRKIKKEISESKLDDNVLILGFVSDEQITYLYRHAVALVMPSYFGPTNIPPLEAMALGCPALVSNKYAMSEQVGDAGLLFNPDLPREIADCIIKVWDNEKLRSELKEKGYIKIKQWTEKDFKKKFIKIVLKNI